MLTKREKRQIEKIDRIMKMSKEEREEYFKELKPPKWFRTLDKFQNTLKIN